MNKAEDRALEKYPILKTELGDINCLPRIGYLEGYEQAEKDVAEAFAKIIRGNLSMVDEKVQVKIEQLYTEITGEKMYKGFKD